VISDDPDSFTEVPLGDDMVVETVDTKLPPEFYQVSNTSPDQFNDSETLSDGRRLDAEDQDEHSLVSEQLNQIKKRDQFIYSLKYLGLRHMALEQIRIQQQYEKRIQQIRLGNKNP
jgi:hypothetical protein